MSPNPSMPSLLVPDIFHQTGEEAVQWIGFGGGSVAKGIYGLLVLIVAFHFVAYLLLRFAKPKFQPMIAPKPQTAATTIAGERK